MLISDWSSDVCSSDLCELGEARAFSDHDAEDSQPAWREHDVQVGPRQQGQRLSQLPRTELDALHGVRERSTFGFDHRGEECFLVRVVRVNRSEEHTSELQSLMRISYAVFCLHKKK